MVRGCGRPGVARHNSASERRITLLRVAPGRSNYGQRELFGRVRPDHQWAFICPGCRRFRDTGPPQTHGASVSLSLWVPELGRPALAHSWERYVRFPENDPAAPAATLFERREPSSTTARTEARSKPLSLDWSSN